MIFTPGCSARVPDLAEKMALKVVDPSGSDTAVEVPQGPGGASRKQTRPAECLGPAPTRRPFRAEGAERSFDHGIVNRHHTRKGMTPGRLCANTPSGSV